MAVRKSFERRNRKTTAVNMVAVTLVLARPVRYHIDFSSNLHRDGLSTTVEFTQLSAWSQSRKKEPKRRAVSTERAERRTTLIHCVFTRAVVWKVFAL